jgi:hypothetical protein
MEISHKEHNMELDLLLSMQKATKIKFGIAAIMSKKICEILRLNFEVSYIDET